MQHPVQMQLFQDRYTRNRRITISISSYMIGLIGALLLASPVMSANLNLSTEQARYKAERKACIDGSSNQDRATCLREAAAAFQAARAGEFKSEAEPVYSHNRLLRCDPLPKQDKEDCVRRMQGEGTQNGSVEGGGILRELVTPSEPTN